MSDPPEDNALPAAVRTLLEALHRDAADHAARLALADALEEAGRLEQAEVARLHARQLMRTGTAEELDRLCALLAGGVRPVVPEWVNSLGMRFALVPPGAFLMGSPEGEEGRSDDEPQHEVELTRPFYLGVHPVTQAQFKAVMGYNPSYFSADGTKAPAGTYRAEPAGGSAEVAGEDTPELPVEKVSHDEAVELCRRLTELERKKSIIVPEPGYRLPSEAQWEYACRGGPSSKPFHFGDKLSSELANFDGRYPYGGADKGDHLTYTTKVGSYTANALGLYDLHGNVQEWCADWYNADYYATSPRRDPVGPPGGSVRVYRGGSWYFGGRVIRGGCRGNSGQFCRSANRNRLWPTARNSFLGFRVSLVSSEG